PSAIHRVRLGAFAGGELQLMQQTPLAQERHPFLRPGVRLRRRADGVVVLPAEARVRLSMLPRQLFTEQRFARLARRAERDPLQREISAFVAGAAGQYSRHTHGISTCQRLQTGCLASKGVRRSGGTGLDEQRTARALVTPALVDRA